MVELSNWLDKLHKTVERQPLYGHTQEILMKTLKRGENIVCVCELSKDGTLKNLHFDLKDSIPTMQRIAMLENDKTFSDNAKLTANDSRILRRTICRLLRDLPALTTPPTSLPQDEIKVEFYKTDQIEFCLNLNHGAPHLE